MKCVMILPFFAWYSGVHAVYQLLNPNYEGRTHLLHKIIPNDEVTDVYLYDDCSASQWYYYTNTYPRIRYCDWQSHYIELDSRIADEIQAMFDTNPPKWLLLRAKGPDADAKPDPFMESIVDRQYELYTTEADIAIYCLMK